MKSAEALRAVIFDWAGTTVDYGSIAPAQVFVEVFADAGIGLTLEAARGPMGLAKRAHTWELLQLPEVRDLWRETRGHEPNETDLDELYARLEPAMEATVARYAEPIRGTVELTEQLRSAGVRVGATTGYTTPIMAPLFPVARQKGWDPEVTVCADQTPAGRPAPWMLFQAMEALGAYPPGRVVAVGDTLADVRAARNAGCWALGVALSGNQVGLSLGEWETLPEPRREELAGAARRGLSDAGAHFVVDGVWDALPVLEEIAGRIEKGEKP